MNEREILSVEIESVEMEKEKLLSEFPFEIQRNIIESFTKRAGIENPHLVTGGGVRNYEGSALGNYRREGEREYLGINFKELLKIQDSTRRKLMFWHVFDHEQIHAVGSSSDGSMGYVPSIGWLFSAWDEGVTEMIARMVTKELYIANGYGAEEVPKGYPVQVEFVELVAKKISEAVGVDPKTVREAIMRGAFLRESNSLLDGTLDELFSDTFPPDFLEKLPMISSKGMEEFIESFKPKIETALQVKDPSILKKLWENLLSKLRKN